MESEDRSIEHLKPQSKYGRTILKNCVLTHKVCNLRLGSKPVWQKEKMKLEFRMKQ